MSFMAIDLAPRVRSIATTTAPVPSLWESPISTAGGNYFGGRSSLFNQPLACLDLSGPGRSHSKHWYVRCPLPSGGSARINSAPQLGQVDLLASPMHQICRLS